MPTKKFNSKAQQWKKGVLQQATPTESPRTLCKLVGSTFAPKTLACRTVAKSVADKTSLIRLHRHNKAMELQVDEMKFGLAKAEQVCSSCPGLSGAVESKPAPDLFGS